MSTALRLSSQIPAAKGPAARNKGGKTLKHQKFNIALASLAIPIGDLNGFNIKAIPSEKRESHSTQKFGHLLMKIEAMQLGAFYKSRHSPQRSLPADAAFVIAAGSKVLVWIQLVLRWSSRVKPGMLDQSNSSCSCEARATRRKWAKPSRMSRHRNVRQIRSQRLVLTCSHMF